MQLWTIEPTVGQTNLSFLDPPNQLEELEEKSGRKCITKLAIKVNDMMFSCIPMMFLFFCSIVFLHLR